MNKDKNKISDTDSFWDQVDTNYQVKETASANFLHTQDSQNNQNQRTYENKTINTPLAAEKSDGSIAIDRDQLLRAVGQLTQNPLEESPLFYGNGLDEIDREKGQQPAKEEQTIFSSHSQKNNAQIRDRKKSSRDKQKREKFVRPVVEKGKNDSVSMSRNTVIAIVAAAVVCLGSFLGIFYKLNADKQEILTYIQTELADIRAKNDAAIAEMGETLGRMETNFDEIVSLLEETGAAIGSSSQESRAAISERIEKLDKQLQSLQKSLAILQEDANGRKK